MARTAFWALLIIAAAATTAGLYFFRDTLAQFALAVILWLGIEGFARWLDAKVPFMPRLLALPIAIVLVLSLVGLVGYFVVINIGAFAQQSHLYVQRLDALAADAHHALNLTGAPPTVGALLAGRDTGRFLALIAQGFRGFASDIVFILIFLGFLFSAAAQVPRKLDLIFPKPETREQTREVLTEIRSSMEEYLWVQTVISVIISTLTYITLLAIGLDNALFWAFLIFFLNYIPTIGSIVATILPTLFALVQFDSLVNVALVAGGVGGWQFIIGNIVQPRMMGDSLNLSAIVVLLSLAIWGSIWGVAGAFLAAPLTVMIAIVLAQFASTRWIAILMSADGKPGGPPRRDKPKAGRTADG